MSCSVNLVPAPRLVARSRRRRGRAWFGIGTLAAGALVVGWLLQYNTQGALKRLTGRLQTLDNKKAEVERRLQAATKQRTELLGELRRMAAARHAQPWPGRLVDLTAAVPSDVFLTQLEIAPPAPRAALASAAPAPSPSAKSAAAKAAAKSAPAPPPTLYQPVRMLGYALDHRALSQLLSALQALEGWEQVELVRATLEPDRGVAFELTGLTREVTP